MASQRYFGTDGIRGVAGEAPMTAEFAFKVGVAAAETLKKAGTARPTVTVGNDTRRSGSMLAHAVSAGLNSRGANVVWLGVIPTPGVSYLTRHLGADAGVVISASHNPFTDNGIKFFNAAGEKLSERAECDIEAILDDAVLAGLPPVGGEGIGDSRRYRREEGDYQKVLLANAPYLDGMRVGLDCANGAASSLAPKIFKQLGARLDVMGDKPDGTNINVDCGSTHPAALQARVLEHGLEAGVTFDGDADRALLVDKRGRLVTGDHMLAILAAGRHEKTVVATLMSNLGLERFLRERGIGLVRTAVGDRYVHERLRAEGLSLGGEQSGHILLLDKAPTGDGMLSALQTLAAVRKSGRPLEDWMDEIPMFPQTLVNVRVSPEAKATVAEHPKVLAAIKDAEVKLGADGRVNLRPSGTEPLIRVMVEGPGQEAIEILAKGIAEAVERAGS